jgi:hypothetical protein
MRAMRSVLVLAGMALAGCGGGDAGKPAASAGIGGASTDTTSVGGRMGMAGMTMIPMMREHMDSLTRMAPAHMSQMLATHERMMSQMMDNMGRDMRGMNMGGNAEWNALSDSVRRDLADLSGLEGTALSDRMKAHGDRVRRLLAAHESMMHGM